MDLTLIILGLALLLFAPLALRLDAPPPPPDPVRQASRRPQAVQFSETPQYIMALHDEQGRRELEALRAAGGPKPGDVITLSNGRRLRVM